MTESENNPQKTTGNEAEAEAEASPSEDSKAAQEKKSRRWVKRLIFLVYMLVLLEIGSRSFFMIARIPASKGI